MKSSKFAMLALLGLVLNACAMDVPAEDNGMPYDDDAELGTSSSAMINDGRGALPGECPGSAGSFECYVWDLRESGGGGVSGGGTGGGGGGPTQFRKCQIRLNACKAKCPVPDVGKVCLEDCKEDFEGCY